MSSQLGIGLEHGAAQIERRRPVVWAKHKRQNAGRDASSLRAEENLETDLNDGSYLVNGCVYIISALKSAPG